MFTLHIGTFVLCYWIQSIICMYSVVSRNSLKRIAFRMTTISKAGSRRHASRDYICARRAGATGSVSQGSFVGTIALSKTSAIFTSFLLNNTRCLVVISNNIFWQGSSQIHYPFLWFVSLGSTKRLISLLLCAEQHSSSLLSLNNPTLLYVNFIKSTLVPHFLIVITTLLTISTQPLDRFRSCRTFTLLLLLLQFKRNQCFNSTRHIEMNAPHHRSTRHRRRTK